MATFGERLKQLRELKTESQEDIAKRFNLSQSTIAYYEADKKQPSQKTLIGLANYFGVSVDYLLGVDNNPQIKAEITDDSFIYTDIDREVFLLRETLNKYIAEGKITEDKARLTLDIARRAMEVALENKEDK